jgi:hypothetical protein
MQSWSLAAIAFLLAAGASLCIGEQAFVDAHDLAALYWVATGAVALRASAALAEKAPR